ncbi:MAG: glucose dehydrogenase [Planctomycetota bacterium]|nr:MAG: glucose dehydrogenase [Planctomycetota bacterium]
MGLRTGFLFVSALLSLAPGLAAQRLKTVRVTSGLAKPLFVTAPAGDADRLFILEQDTARIRIFKNGGLLGTPFLDLGSIASGGGERGLLGMAFHPNYAQNGQFFVNYTNNSGATVVARYNVSANPDVADAGSGFTIMTIGQPFSNHNGGMIAFGPNDGYLYIGTGDGGSAGDPGDRAQNGLNLLGKMLRIDVDGGSPYAVPNDNPFVGNPAVSDEIWHIGHRNPWRFCFDPLNGDMYIADVGQNKVEEVSYQAGSSPGGENYGWRLMEGEDCFNPSTNCNNGTLELPIHTYRHSFTPFRCSITGGYVYRGSEIPGLQGTYFFAEWCSDEIWTFRYQNGSVVDFRERTDELRPSGLNIRGISSFGLDGNGELYICDHDGGEVFRVLPDLMTLTSGALVAGQSVTLDVSDATSGQQVYFVYSLSGLGTTAVNPLNVYLGVSAPVLAGASTANGSGQASFSANIPPQAGGLQVWIQAAENGNTSNVLAETVQ